MQEFYLFLPDPFQKSLYCLFFVLNAKNDIIGELYHGLTMFFEQLYLFSYTRNLTTIFKILYGITVDYYLLYYIKALCIYSICYYCSYMYYLNLHYFNVKFLHFQELPTVYTKNLGNFFLSVLS